MSRCSSPICTSNLNTFVSNRGGNVGLLSERFVIDALRVKSPCLSKSMHKLPFRPIHRLERKPHRRPSKKSSERLLDLKTPTFIIGKVI